MAVSAAGWVVRDGCCLYRNVHRLSRNGARLGTLSWNNRALHWHGHRLWFAAYVPIERREVNVSGTSPNCTDRRAGVLRADRLHVATGFQVP